jgi:hypothetical protein
MNEWRADDVHGPERVLALSPPGTSRSAVHCETCGDEHHADGEGDRCEDRTVKVVTIEKLARGYRVNSDRGQIQAESDDRRSFEE